MMFVHVLLVLGYWFVGVIYATLACCCIGLAICAFMALWRIRFRRGNWGLLTAYLLFSVASALAMWGGLFAIGWLGDRTDHFGQVTIIVGIEFPGIFAVKIITAYVRMANKQTLGIEIE